MSRSCASWSLTVSPGSGESERLTLELTALLKGLRALKRPSLVCVHSDSKYVIKPFTEGWISRWEAKRWHKVKNADIWHALIAAHARHIVTFEWVPGHSGERYNERCDELAGAARRSAPVQRQQPG